MKRVTKLPGDMVKYVNASDYEEFGPLGLGLIIQLVPASDGEVKAPARAWYLEPGDFVGLRSHEEHEVNEPIRGIVVTVDTDEGWVLVLWSGEAGGFLREHSPGRLVRQG